MKSDLEKLRHARAAKDFPDIDLIEGEYVELAIERSRRGLIMIWAGEVAGFIFLTIILVLLMSDGANNIIPANGAAKTLIQMVIFALYVVLLISGFVGSYLYGKNHMYVTNKRVIQKTRSNLLAHSTNIIELGSIEDVSFKQEGLLDYALRMGTIRMSTVGDETTYTFPYVDTPRDEIKTITHLVHKAKKS